MCLLQGHMTRIKPSIEMIHTGWTPRHLSALSTLSEPVCSLGTSGGALLLVLKSRMRTKGDRVTGSGSLDYGIACSSS